MSLPCIFALSGVFLERIFQNKNLPVGTIQPGSLASAASPNHLCINVVPTIFRLLTFVTRGALDHQPAIGTSNTVFIASSKVRKTNSFLQQSKANFLCTSYSGKAKDITFHPPGLQGTTIPVTTLYTHILSINK